MPAFVLPDLGEGLTEAEIVSWHVQVGDTVAVDQDVVEVETAKAVVEIPVPFAGRVAELHASPGDLLAVGAPLITVPDDRTPPPAENGASGAVLIGYGPSDAGPRRRRPARNGPPQPRQEPAPPPPRPPGRVAVVSPIVRRLARNAGLDLATISGSGHDGLITRQDVERAIAAQPEPVTARRAEAEPVVA